MSGRPMCSKCRFYEEDQKDYRGHCVRHAPHPAMVLDSHNNSVQYYRPVWPIVLSDQFCGEFEPKTADAGKEWDQLRSKT